MEIPFSKIAQIRTDGKLINSHIFSFISDSISLK